ncbi:general stress protein [Escherichia coli]|uniref:general stress protein n=1 Tax=Escherichia coli TaxID=562 RepID=UPI000BEA4980|nr:general stress protein [Escherichia coli]
MTEHRGGAGNFAEDRQKASDAGRKGGQHSGGNFKNDPQRALRDPLIISPKRNHV